MNKPLRIVIRIAAGFGAYAVSSFALDALFALFSTEGESIGLLQTVLIIASIILPIALGVIVGIKIPLPMKADTQTASKSFVAGNSNYEPAPIATKQKDTTNAEPRKEAAVAKNKYILVPASMVMHRPSCRYAQNLIGTSSFTDSRSAALSVGYRPCKYCKP